MKDETERVDGVTPWRWHANHWCVVTLCRGCGGVVAVVQPSPQTEYRMEYTGLFWSYPDDVCPLCGRFLVVQPSVAGRKQVRCSLATGYYHREWLWWRPWTWLFVQGRWEVRQASTEAT